MDHTCGLLRAECFRLLPRSLAARIPSQGLPALVVSQLGHPSSFDLLPPLGGRARHAATSLSPERSAAHGADAADVSTADVASAAVATNEIVREGNPTLSPHFAAGRVLPPWLADLAFCRMLELTRQPAALHHAHTHSAACA